MPGKLHKRNDRFGTALVNDQGQVEKVLKRCPHCGMIDYEFSTNGIKDTHWPNWHVGARRYYQCGKCRKYFYTLEIQVPLDIEPHELYKNINETLAPEGME